MAGNYPDAPGPRIAYDRDGTQVVTIAGGVVTPIATATVTALNSENNVMQLSGRPTVCFIFPQLMDLVGLIAVQNDGSIQTTWQSSPDTTNGIDGTWTQILGDVRKNQPVVPIYRTDISPVTANGIRGLKLISGSNFGSPGFFVIHLYGTISANQNMDRLRFWHPTLDQGLNLTPAWLDWGNRPRASSATKQVRLKNASSVLTANSITVSMQALTDANPAYVSQHLFDYNNSGVFNPSITISSLAPGEVSAPITIQQTLVASAAVGVWAQRIAAVVSSWA